MIIANCVFLQTAVIHGNLLAVEHMRKDKGGKGGLIIYMASIAGTCYHSGHERQQFP